MWIHQIMCQVQLDGVKWLSIPGNLERQWHWIDRVLTWSLTLWFDTKPKTYSITKLRAPQWPSIQRKLSGSTRSPFGLFLRTNKDRNRAFFWKIHWNHSMANLIRLMSKPIQTTWLQTQSDTELKMPPISCNYIFTKLPLRKDPCGLRSKICPKHQLVVEAFKQPHPYSIL